MTESTAQRVLQALPDLLDVLDAETTRPTTIDHVLAVLGEAAAAEHVTYRGVGLDGQTIASGRWHRRGPSDATGPRLRVTARGGSELVLTRSSHADPWDAATRRALQAAVRAISSAGAAVAADGERRRLTRRHVALDRHSSDIVLELDERLMIHRTTPSASRLLGWHVGDTPVPLDQLVDAEDLVGLEEVLARTMATKVEHLDTGDFRLCTADGTRRWFAGTAIDLRAEPAVAALTLVLHDITTRKASEALLRHRAMHDPLTELANRTLLLDRLDLALRRSAGCGSTVAVALFDLDRFKPVNDGFGHAIGDDLLRVVGRRLRANVRGSDTVARLGGDEFAVLLEDLDDADHAESLVDRLCEVLREPIRLGATEPHRISASVGLVIPSASPDADSILRDADAAMYQAKHRGRDQVVRFGVNLRQRHLRRISLADELTHAIDRQELHLVYQPVHRVRDGLAVGVEALLRWRHPTYGVVSPSEFIPIAEENGTITAIGRYVLDRSLERLAHWDRQTAGRRPLMLGVNVSARQLDDPRLIDDVDRLLTVHAVAPSRLTVEVTESAAMSSPETGLRTLHAFRRRGIGVAIDDFGTGYSSLATLSQLPATVLKIDRSFVLGLGHEERDSRVVAAIIGLAKELGLAVVAEGVETESQRRILSDLGCALLQGYALARPASLDDLDPADVPPTGAPAAALSLVAGTH